MTGSSSGDAVTPAAPIDVASLQLCFEGAIPAVIATASADGIPNITYLSRVRMVDDEHVALSNQFFSKTSRNLAENPRASLLLIDPTTYDQFRLDLVYERTERRGPVFQRLREDVDALASLQGMQDVFKLRSADIYRVLHVEQVLADAQRRGVPPPRAPERGRDAERLCPPENQSLHLAELSSRLSRCPDLDTLVSAVVDGLAEFFGYQHSSLLLLDEEGRRLYTIASHGYDTQGVGSEVVVGEGTIGVAAARAKPIRVGNLRHMDRYARIVRQSFEDHGGIGPGCEIPLPGLPDASSQIAVPAVALGELIGVLMVESEQPVAFDAADEAVLTVIATLAAGAIELERSRARADESAAGAGDQRPRGDDPSTPSTHVRFFPVDGSTFVDGDYLIKGVAGRILWSLLNCYEQDGRVEFTNREVRLDPNLELPEFRDNFESRLILLKRRLDERGSSISIEKTGRGRFRLVIDTTLRLESVPT